jgi:prepilin-type N-terminal cleavage/methylation domain-containing protein
MTPLEHHSPNTDRSRRAGFTLVESLIASVVLAVAVVGISGTLASSYQQSKDQVSSAEATQLARQLMEEISGKPFEVPQGSANNAVGWSGGNRNRATYDDVQDYHGFTDTSTSITTLGGATQSFGTAGPYTRSVTVTAGPVPVGHTAPAADFKRVTVTVTRPRGTPVVISKYFTRATLAI